MSASHLLSSWIQVAPIHRGHELSITSWAKVLWKHYTHMSRFSLSRAGWVWVLLFLFLFLAWFGFGIWGHILWYWGLLLAQCSFLVNRVVLGLNPTHWHDKSCAWMESGFMEDVFRPTLWGLFVESAWNGVAVSLARPDVLHQAFI